MALLSEINTAADTMATLTSNARAAIPSTWYPQEYLPLVTNHMKKAEANAIFQISNLPYQNALAYGQTAVDKGSLGQGWFNKGNGWAEAAARRVPLTGEVQLRGVVYCGAINTYPTIMTLPAQLCPAKNEQFPVTMLNNTTGLFPATVYIYTSGVVGIWAVGLANGAVQTVVDYLTLTGIRYEAAY